MTFRLREHTADVAVEATAPTLSALFADIAAGLTAAMCEDVPASGDRFAIEVGAESREALLFDYLDELIYQRDVREVLPTDHEVRIEEDADTEPGVNRDPDDGWRLTATARGVPFAEVTARDVKAATYSEMTIERRDGEWYAYVVFDV